MPDFDDKAVQQPNTGSAKQHTPNPDSKPQRPTNGRVSIGKGLGFIGDKSRSALFNSELDKMLEDNQAFKEVLLYGKVADFEIASVNYLGVRSTDGGIVAVALVFENQGRYVRDPKSQQVWFTYDMLTDRDNSFHTTVTNHIAAEHNCSFEDVQVIDAQVLAPDFKVTTESVRHLAYTLGTLMDNLSGYEVDGRGIDQFPQYSARLTIQPGAIYEGMYTHRADFRIDTNQHSNKQRKFVPSIMGDGADADSGKTTVVGFVDAEYTGPRVSPELYEGPAEKFQPQQFTQKTVIANIDTSASESFIYERGILALASIGEVHNKCTGMDILTRTIDSDKSIDITALISNMWLNVPINPPKIKSIDDIRDALEMMFYTDESYVTILHRSGDTQNGVLHMLARIGEGDATFLAILLESLNTIHPELEERLMRTLGKNTITCDDIIMGSVPRLFGVFNDSGRQRVIEEFDLLHVAPFGQSDRSNYGDWLAATSLEHRELKAAESQDYQMVFLEEAVTGTEIQANGAEYVLTPEFISFLYHEVLGQFDDIDMSGFTDCRVQQSRHHRTQDADRRVLKGRTSTNSFNDTRHNSFGSFRR